MKNGEKRDVQNCYDYNKNLDNDDDNYDMMLMVVVMMEVIHDYHYKDDSDNDEDGNDTDGNAKPNDDITCNKSGNKGDLKKKQSIKATTSLK